MATIIGRTGPGTVVGGVHTPSNSLTCCTTLLTAPCAPSCCPGSCLLWCPGISDLRMWPSLSACPHPVQSSGPWGPGWEGAEGVFRPFCSHHSPGRQPGGGWGRGEFQGGYPQVFTGCLLWLQGRMKRWLTCWQMRVSEM